MGSFVFRWPYPADDVHITGTFDDWGKSIQMDRVGEHWEKEVELPTADDKVLYKFIVNNEWIVDDNAPKEGDGHYNTNNVLYPHQITRKPIAAATTPATETKDVSSEEQDAPQRTSLDTQGVPGAFPETPANENTMFGVRPIPASSGIGNPISVPAGETLPSQRDIPSTAGSTVTTSKEDYEKAGSSTAVPGAADDPISFSVNPIPASVGVGNPVSVAPGEPLPSQKDLSSTRMASDTTTSKEDYEKAGSSAAVPEPDSNDPTGFSVNPIPASSGIGNPIHTTPGEALPTHANVSSTADTTSKEDYEKAGSSAAIPESGSNDPSGFSVNPIPASSGIGNPIHTSPGEALPIHENVSSAADTTSKEDYEKAGDSAAAPESGASDPSGFSVNPIPASSGIGNPIHTTPGEALPIHENVSSAADTTSKEDYEKAGDSGASDPSGFSINPIPASSGVGNPITTIPGEPLPTQAKVSSAADTTSKEDYEKAGSSAAPEPAADDPSGFSVNPIPASSGIGNPINLAPGAPVPAHEPVSSAADTTSKEAYENTGSGAFPAFGAAAAAAGGALGGAVLGGALASTKDKRPFIPESSLPMNPEKSDAIDVGPFITSSGPGTTTAELASRVPLEKNPVISSSGSGTTADLASRAPLEDNPTITSSGPGTTTEDLASKVPLESNQIMRSSGPGTTTGDLASRVPLENDPFIRSSGPDASTARLASELEVPLRGSPFISSSGPGTTTSQLAAKVPQETSPFMRSSGPDTTTDALAANVPLESAKQTESTDVASGVPETVKESISAAHEAPEAASSPEAVQEKAALEKELLSKTKTNQSTGEPASSAPQQTSYYGLATTIPQTVEKSMQRAQAPQEAAAESSAVAEKSAVERELLSKIPSTDEAGEPAPTLAASTSPTAPTSTSTSVPVGTSTTAAATSLTDGKTANEPVPDTDTSTASRGLSAGEIAGGAIVGSGAAAGAAALAARHKDADVEPPRVTDSQKPDITTEASPATALSDNTEYPSLADEPAVQMMKQNEGISGEPTPATIAATTSEPTTKAADTAPVHDATTDATATATGTGTTDPVASGLATDDAETKAVTTATDSAPLHDSAAGVAGTSGAGAADVHSEAADTGLVHDITTLDPNTTTSTKDISTGASATGAAAIASAAADMPTSGAATDKASAAATGSAPAHDATTGATTTLDSSSLSKGDAGAPATTTSESAPASAGISAPSSTEYKDVGPKDVGPSVSTPSEPKMPSTPAKQTISSSAANNSAASTPGSTATEKKKKRHRLSTFIKKIFD